MVFTLFVEDFGLKVNSLDDAHHLINAILKIKCSIDWEGQNYLGLSLDWNYAKNYVDISLPRYTPTALHKFQHKLLAHYQDPPRPWNKPVYGKHIQLDTQQRSTPKLNSTEKNIVQSIKDTFLYYACAVKPTMLPAINDIFTFQSAPTQDTMEKFNQVLDYASTNPNSTIWYHANNMILMTDTYAS